MKMSVIFAQSLAPFQVNKKLYLCGGFQKTALSDFYCVDYQGKTTTLPEMKSKRNFLSLAGLTSHLISLGGWRGRPLKASEKYKVGSNKWSHLPSLVAGRCFSGSILLKSMRAFTFCGSLGSKQLNSIESIQVDCEAEWRTLPLNGKIANAYDIAAVSFKSMIVVFGS